ncbi:MAG: hypothetical protein P4M11_14165 [Candidatus Pacebacteria bacterium]|nr:hypothetical protein [Candidatus Paceibacterota bacterium]
MLLDTFDEGLIPILKLVQKIIQCVDEDLHAAMCDAVQDVSI